MFLDAHGARPETGWHFCVVGPHPVQEPRSHKQTLVLLGLNRQQPDSAMASVPAAMMTVIALLMVVFMVYLRLISDGNAILADAAGDMHFLNESMLYIQRTRIHAGQCAPWEAKCAAESKRGEP